MSIDDWRSSDLGNQQLSIDNRQFDGQAVTPTVLLAEEFLSQLPLLAIRVRVEHPTRSSPFVLSNANLDPGVALDVLHHPEDTPAMRAMNRKEKN